MFRNQRFVRALKESPIIVRSKMQIAPRLLKHHITARENFGKRNMATNWKSVSIVAFRLK